MLLYNIRYGAGIGRRFHLPVPYSGYFKSTNGHFKNILDFVKSVNPDIIGLIEVDFGSYRVEKCNQAEIMAMDMGHQAVYHNKYAKTSMARKVPLLSKQGNAILTNRDILKQRFHFFREGVKRLVIEVELPEVTVFLVHLSLKFRHRHYQLNDLNTLIAGATKPVIVAGDFNALWGDRELQLFLSASGLISANSRGLPSFPSRNPVRELDYIFHSPEIQSSGFQIPPVKFSDHTPLLWEFSVHARTSEMAAAKPVKKPGWSPVLFGAPAFTT